MVRTHSLNRDECNEEAMPSGNYSTPSVRTRIDSHRLPGRLAQLVEHLIYTERVTGSSPVAPTQFNAEVAQW